MASYVISSVPIDFVVEYNETLIKKICGMAACIQ